METSETKETSMTLASLCAQAGLTVPAEGGDTRIRGLTADSRRVKPGWLFIALCGRRVDARSYIPAALLAGAAAVVCEPPDDAHPLPKEDIDPRIPVLIVPDSRAAMAYLFDAWCGHPGRRLRLIGVTGTNGKTSVAAMLRHILTHAGHPCGLIGTLGSLSPAGRQLDGAFAPSDADSRSGMTTPDPEELYPLLSAMAHEGGGASGGETPFVVMEVTSHALALSKVAPLTFELAVFTNLSSEHMDLHGTMEDYFSAKARLFSAARTGVILLSDPYGRRLLSMGLPVEPWYVCRTEDTPPPMSLPAGENARFVRCTASDVSLCGAAGVAYRLTTPDVRLRLTCPVPGAFSAQNSVEAAVSALALGLPPESVREALAAFPGVPGRVERVVTDIPADFTVFIDFAHTPDALEKLLGEFLRFRREGREGRRRGAEEIPIRRLVVLFGCGGDRDVSKRRQMGRIASRMADEVIITSDNSRSEDPMDIIREILRGVDKERPHAVIPDRREAIFYAISHARPGDVILLCGKGHETYEVDAAGRHPFCERDVVLEAMAARRRDPET